MLFASSVAVTHRTLETVDLVIIGVYFAIVFGIGFYFSKKERTSEDYFLASRNIGWFAIGASIATARPISQASPSSRTSLRRSRCICTRLPSCWSAWWAGAH